MSNFRVGQKVVCVDNDPHWERPLPAGFDGWIGDLDGLRNGAVYTVNAVYTSPYTGEPCVGLAEIVRTSGHGGYVAWRFRPVAYPKQSLEHDIALFLDTPSHVRTSDKERA